MTIMLQAKNNLSRFSWRVYCLARLALHPHVFFTQLYALNWYRDTLHAWLTWLNPPTHSRILEVGCNTGSFALELAQRGHSVVGVDRSARAIGHAQRQQHDQLQFMTGDALQLPPLAQFSYTLAASLLNVVDEPSQLLAEMMRVTAANGVVSCLFPTQAMTPEAAHQFIQAQSLSGFSAQALSLWASKALKLEAGDVMDLFAAANLADVHCATFLQGMVCAVRGRVE
jgi:ubiquinone/menaquinone biosynthesis C-methylase UbiE